MIYEQIAEMMEEMELPFAYHHFAEGESPAPPFLLFLYQPLHQIKHVLASKHWKLKVSSDESSS